MDKEREREKVLIDKVNIRGKKTKQQSLLDIHKQQRGMTAMFYERKKRSGFGNGSQPPFNGTQAFLLKCIH